MQPDSSIPCSYNLAAGLYREPSESSPHLRNLFLHHWLSPIIRCITKCHGRCALKFCDQNFVRITNCSPNPLPHRYAAYSSYLGPIIFGDEHTWSSSSLCKFHSFFETTCLVYSTVFLISISFIILNSCSYRSVTQLLHGRPAYSNIRRQRLLGSWLAGRTFKNHNK